MLFSCAASRMCASAGITGSPSPSVAAKSGVSSSFLPGERRTAWPCPGRRRLLVAEPVAVPRLDEHPDPARHQVAAAAHPGLVGRLGPTQTCWSSAAASSALMLRVPSLNPIRLRGVAWAGAGGRRAAEAELGPPHDDGAPAQPGEVADGVEGHLRVVRAGLDARCRRRCGSGRGSPAAARAGRLQRGRAAWRPARTGRRTAPGPNPIVMVRLDGGSPTASPVSAGGTSGDRRVARHGRRRASSPRPRRSRSAAA